MTYRLNILDHGRDGGVDKVVERLDVRSNYGCSQSILLHFVQREYTVGRVHGSASEECAEVREG